MKRPAGVRESVLLVVGSEALGTVALLLVPVVLTRVLTREDVGIYKQFQLVQQTLMIFAVAGFPEALLYFVARKGERALEVVLSILVQMALVLGLLGAVLALGGDRVVAAVAGGLDSRVGELFLAVAFSALGDSLFVVQSAQRKFRAYGAVRVTFTVLQAGLVVAAAWATHGVDWVLHATVAGAFLKALAALAWIVREGARDGWPRRLKPIREILAYSAPVAGATMVKSFHGRLHQYFISSSYSASTFALYGVATTKVPILGMLRGSVVQVMTPHFASMEEEQRHAAIRSLWHASVSRLSLVYYPAAFLLVGFAPEIISFAFTDAYREAAPLFRIFALLMLTESQGGIEGILKAYRQTGFILRVSVLQLALGLAFAWIGLATIGIAGPAVAVVLTAAIAQAVRVLKIRQLQGIPLSGVLPWRSQGLILLGGAVAAVAGVLASRPFGSDVLRLAVGGAVAGPVYLAWVLVADLVPEKERAQLARVARMVRIPLSARTDR